MSCATRTHGAPCRDQTQDLSIWSLMLYHQVIALHKIFYHYNYCKPPTSPFAILQLNPLFGKPQSTPSLCKYNPAVSRRTSLFTPSSRFCIVRKFRKCISQLSSECSGENVNCFGMIFVPVHFGMLKIGFMSWSDVW